MIGKFLSPEGYFEEKPAEAKREPTKPIPEVPDFVPAARPINKKPDYPSFRQRCIDAPEEEPERVITDDWLKTCWYTRSHWHGYFTFTDHRENIGWVGSKSEAEKDKCWKMKHRQQKSFQKIELQSPDINEVLVLPKDEPRK
eukprot:6479376-Amphidinium_carterae.2